MFNHTAATELQVRRGYHVCRRKAYFVPNHAAAAAAEAPSTKFQTPGNIQAPILNISRGAISVEV